MHNSTLTLYGRLRLLVGYLGEKSQENWWSTSFFEPAIRVFLEPVFSQTIRLSHYNGVREAARNIHDVYIGVGEVFHLFRLPEEVEQDLQQLIFEAPNEWFTEVSSRDNALNTLRPLADVGIPLTALCSEIEDLGSRDTFPFEERTRLKQALDGLLQDNLDLTRQLLVNHERSIWRGKGENQEQWSLLQTALNVVTECLTRSRRTTPL